MLYNDFSMIEYNFLMCITAKFLEMKSYVKLKQEHHTGLQTLNVLMKP